MDFRIVFERIEGRVQWDNIYEVKESTEIGTVRILMLKGEDGSGVPAGGTTNQVLAKASNASDDLKWMTLSFVPTTRTVNGKALSNNISLTADDVGAMTIPYSDFVPNDGDMIVYNANHSRWDVKTVEAEDVGAIPAPSSPSAGQFLVYDGSAWVAQTLSQWSGGSY